MSGLLGFIFSVSIELMLFLCILVSLGLFCWMCLMAIGASVEAIQGYSPREKRRRRRG